MRRHVRLLATLGVLVVAAATVVVVQTARPSASADEPPGPAARAGDLEGVLVAVEGNDSVLALDPQTMRTRRVLSLGEFPGQKMPHELRLHPDGRTLLVTEYAFGALGLYDVRTGELEAEIPVGGGPHGLALSPDGAFAYVAASQSKWLAVVDLAARAVVAQIPTQLLPWDVVVTPDGASAWVTTQGAEKLLRVDLAANEPGATVDLGEPYAVAAGLLPDGRLVAGGHASNRLFLVDPATGEVIDRPSLGGAPPDIAELEGPAMYFCQISPSGGAMPVAMAVRPGHDELLVAAHGTDEVVVMSASDLSVVRRIAVGEDPQRLTVSPDGRFAFVTAGGSGELWRIDLDGGRTVRASVGSRPIGVIQT